MRKGTAFLRNREDFILRPVAPIGTQRPVTRPQRTIVAGAQLQPLVSPQVTHLRQVPLRTKVKLPHAPHASPS